MLLEPQELPAELFEGWEAEIVETTALGDNVVKRSPTGHTETYRTDTEDTGCGRERTPAAAPKADAGSRLRTKRC